MPGTEQPTALILIVAFLVALPVIAAVSERLRLPYTVALVVAGLGLSALPVREAGLGVSPQLVATVLLPGLVFEAAYRLDAAELRRTFGAIVLLAVPGVLVTAAVVALVLAAGTGLPLGEAVVVGAIVSATDPVAVVSTMRRLSAPRQLVTLVDAESLFNDGTAAIVFAIALAALSAPVAPLAGAATFAWDVVASSLIGGLVGAIAIRWLVSTRDHLIELTLTLLAAYGSYLVADLLHLSGIIASVVAAIVLGTLGRRGPMSDRGEEAIDVVWEFLAFVLTAAAFLLVGIGTPLATLERNAGPIAAGVVAVLVGRALVVYVLLGGASLVGGRLGHQGLGLQRLGLPRLPLGWLHVLSWTGLRGAVAAVLALSLPADLVHRDVIQGIVFGIILFTVLVQGTTAGRVVAWATTGTGPGEAGTGPGEAGTNPGEAGAGTGEAGTNPGEAGTIPGEPRQPVGRPSGR